MNPLPPEGYDWDQELQLGDETARLTMLSWPNFLVEPSDIPDPGLTFELTQQEIARRLPVWGIRRESDKALVAYAHGALIAADLSKNHLPDLGWQFAIESAFSNEPRNCMCLLAANVDPQVRSLGHSQLLLEKSKLITHELGFKTMIGPVRPTLKSDFPLMPMTEYMAKKTDSGEIYDPWLRLHTKCGGEVLNICSQSVVVRATLPKWREWTGLPLSTSGDQVLKMGLVPLKIDLQKNIGVYTEPNVWFRYRI
jgi:hypothetical protein